MKKPDPRKAISIADVLEKYRGTIPSNSFLENAVLGVNKSTRDLKLGIGGLLSDALPESVGVALGLPTRADVDVEKAADEELMGTGGGLLGSALGNMAMAAIGGGVVGAPVGIGQNMLTGAGMGFIKPAGTEDSRIGNVAFGGALGAIGPATKAIVGKLMDKISPKEAVLTPEMLRALAHRPVPSMGMSGDDIASGAAPHMINDAMAMGPMTGYEAPGRFLGGYGGQTAGRMFSERRIPDSVLKLNREFDDLMKQALDAQQKQALIDELSKYQLLPVAGAMGARK